MITGKIGGKTGRLPGKKKEDLQLNVPRIGDLPLYSSPPMQFTFKQKATLTLGQYIFSPVRTDVTNNKNLNNSTLIYFRNFSFSVSSG